MRTRTGACYPDPGIVTKMCSFGKRKPRDTVFCAKRHKKCSEKKTTTDYDFFESLPDDIVISIFCRLSSTATSPSDFVSVLLTFVFLTSLVSTFVWLFHIINELINLMIFVEQV